MDTACFFGYSGGWRLGGESVGGRGAVVSGWFGEEGSLRGVVCVAELTARTVIG